MYIFLHTKRDEYIIRKSYILYYPTVRLGK